MIVHSEYPAPAANPLAQLTDREVETRLAEAWDLFRAVSTGNSARAVDNRWAAYAELRDEWHRRTRGGAGQGRA